MSIKATRTIEQRIDPEKMDKKRTKIKQLKDGAANFGDELTFDVPEYMLPDVNLTVALKAKRYTKKNVLVGSNIIKSESRSWKYLLDESILETLIPVFKTSLFE